MSPAEINQVLTTALKKSADYLAKEELDQEGQYFPDITGLIQAYDELGLFVAGEKIHYDEIRHVTLDPQAKWSQLS